MSITNNTPKRDYSDLVERVISFELHDEFLRIEGVASEEQYLLKIQPGTTICGEVRDHDDLYVYMDLIKAGVGGAEKRKAILLENMDERYDQEDEDIRDILDMYYSAGETEKLRKLDKLLGFKKIKSREKEIPMDKGYFSIIRKQFIKEDSIRSS